MSRTVYNPGTLAHRNAIECAVVGFQRKVWDNRQLVVFCKKLQLRTE